MHRLRPDPSCVLLAQSTLYQTNSAAVPDGDGGVLLVGPGVYPGRLDAPGEDHRLDRWPFNRDAHRHSVEQVRGRAGWRR